MSRNRNRSLATNSENLYRKVFKKKGVRAIMQYTTPIAKRPTQEALDTIRYQEYIWTVGDRFWRLADRMYGNKDMLFIIARFNNKPTEAHVKAGETIKIPLDIGRAREVLG